MAVTSRHGSPGPERARVSVRSAPESGERGEVEQAGQVLAVEHQAVDKPNQLLVTGPKRSPAFKPALHHPFLTREQRRCAWESNGFQNFTQITNRGRLGWGKRAGHGMCEATIINHAQRDNREDPTFQVAPLSPSVTANHTRQRARRGSPTPRFDSRRCVDSPGNERRATGQASHLLPASVQWFSRTKRRLG